MSEAHSKQPPKGYADVSIGGSVVDWDNVSVVEGEVLRVKTIKTKFGDTRMMLVRAGDETYKVWASAGLSDLFDNVSPGDGVYMEYTRMVKLEDGQSMREFVVGHKPKGE